MNNQKGFKMFVCKFKISKVLRYFGSKRFEIEFQGFDFRNVG